MADLATADVTLLHAELAREDLQVYTVVRMARLDVERGDVDAAIARLRIDADKLRCHDTMINRLLASH